MNPETMILPDGSEVVVIHYLSQPKYGKLFVACMPGVEDFVQPTARPIMRTDECRSVTCPLCKATEVHKKALEMVFR